MSGGSARSVVAVRAVRDRLSSDVVGHRLRHAAGFATPHYLTLRMALEIAEDAMTPRAGNKGYSSDTVRFLQAQYEKLRGDEAKLRLLLGN